MDFCIKVKKPLVTTIFQVFLMSSKEMNKLKMQINIFDYWKNIKKILVVNITACMNT